MHGIRTYGSVKVESVRWALLPDTPADGQRKGVRPLYAIQSTSLIREGHRRMNYEQRKRILVEQILPYVQGPAQYLGGEVNAIRKDHQAVRGTLCLAFPDTYKIGMSHHGLQVLYSLMNERPDWACERVFTPWIDMEARLQEVGMPLSSLETVDAVVRV